MGLKSWIKGLKKEKVPPIHLTDDSFHDEVMRSKLPVLVDVWGPSCAPCMKLVPVMIDLATDYQGRIKVAELDASENPKTSRKLGVSGTPTVVFFHQGRVVERVVGFRGSLYFKEIIETEFPDFVGMSEEEAEALQADGGMEPEAEEEPADGGGSRPVSAKVKAKRSRKSKKRRRR